MKALPLWQPWASLVALGAKRVETRAYPPKRLGLHDGQRIAIHATKTKSELWICEQEHFRDHIADAAALPLGALVATCTISRAHRVTQADADALAKSNPKERAFGDYTPGRWAWVLTNVKALPSPVPFTGSQGTFDVPDELAGHVAAINVDCSYPNLHTADHHEHATNPRPGRLVCHQCHTPAGVLLAQEA